eukprot:13094753-Heterocapsa_arctica.AAC.1
MGRLVMYLSYIKLLELDSRVFESRARIWTSSLAPSNSLQNTHRISHNVSAREADSEPQKRTRLIGPEKPAHE